MGSDMRDSGTSGSAAADSAAEKPRAASPLQTAKAVLWSFAGIRRKADYEQDSASLNPVHVIIAGVIGAALFVLLLLALVKFVVLAK
jgi:hypothetical protein